MAFPGKNEEEKHPPDFRPLSSPISCIDHQITKGKINEILRSIRQFEDEVHYKNQEREEVFTNIF
jgi:hypothetical protein